MQSWDFELTFDGQTVAKGTASTAMTFQFMMIHLSGVSKQSNMIGFVPTLDNMLARKTGENHLWGVTDIDGKHIGFFAERIN